MGKESNTSQPDKSELKNSKKFNVKISQGKDFLSFVEEKERILLENKNSLATESTHAGVTNLGGTLSKNPTEIGNERPLSGGLQKVKNFKGKSLMKKKQKFVRPKTAKHPVNLLEKSNEQKLSTFNPSSTSGDKEARQEARHLSEIIESEKNSSIDFEYSSKSSEEIVENCKNLSKQNKSKSILENSLKQKSNFGSKRDSGTNYGSTKFENLKQLASLESKRKHSRNNDPAGSISDINPLKTSRRNPSEIGNIRDSHQFKESMISNNRKEFESEMNTQLNIGSPIQGARKMVKNPVKMKRPNSAKIHQYQSDTEPLKIDSLISIVGIKRNKCKMNLNSLLNSKEVMSNNVKIVKTQKYHSRDSSSIRI